MLDIHRELEGDGQDLPMSETSLNTGLLRAVRILLHVWGSPGGGSIDIREAGEGTVPARAQHGGGGKGL